MHDASCINPINQPLRGNKMAELQQMMFYEDLIIALIYFIGFGGLLLIGGSFEAAGNLILKWVRGRHGR